MSLSHIRNIALILLIACLLVMSVGGAYTAQTMMEEGSTHHCPFMGVPALCAMNPLAHIAEWQNMFASIMQNQTVLDVLALIVLALFWFLSSHLYLPRRSDILIHRFRHTYQLFDSLRLALARGIIHPKPF